MTRNTKVDEVALAELWRESLDVIEFPANRGDFLRRSDRHGYEREQWTAHEYEARYGVDAIRAWKHLLRIMS